MTNGELRTERLLLRRWRPEAARAALTAGRAERPGHEVTSVIHPRNERSQSVATKLGMRRARQVPNPLLSLDTDVWILHALPVDGPKTGHMGRFSAHRQRGVTRVSRGRRPRL